MFRHEAIREILISKSKTRWGHLADQNARKPDTKRLPAFLAPSERDEER
jgi:hypothetical protein